ncbi:MAG: tripartite tricarboxylate transporter substrate-binding protein [Burkholderiales bacterium]
MPQINIEALKARMGIDVVHIPYKGAGTAVQAVATGEASLTITSPTAVLGFLRQGRLRALVIDAKKRSVLMPEVAERLNKAGLEPTGGTGAELLALVKRDIPRFREIVQRVGIEAE